MWNDTQSEIDLLGFARYVDAIEKLVSLAELQPLTIGVYGPWGSGKSSVMAMAHQRLKKNDHIASVWLSSWTLEGTEHVRTALITGLLQAMEEKQTLFGGVKEKIRGLRKLLNLQRTAALLAKTGISVAGTYAATQVPGAAPVVAYPSLDEFASIFETKDEKADDVTALTSFRERFDDLLQHAKAEALVVFLDDLDRCTPRFIVQNFEAIRLFLSVPKTVFVIGASEEIIRDAINTQYEGGAENDLGRQYLEKIIQIPIHIPALSQAETTNYVHLLFAQRSLPKETFTTMLAAAIEMLRGERYDDALTYAEIIEQVPTEQQSDELQRDLQIANQVAPSLYEGTRGNPREVKRFLNMLLLRSTIAQSSGLTLNIGVMAKLMLLEYYFGDFYQKLMDWRIEFEGAIPHLAYLERELARASESERETEEGAIGNDKAEFTRAIIDASTTWLEKPGLRRVLQIAPPLSEHELAPYFYLARGRTEERGGTSARLSKRAADALNYYRQGGDLLEKRAEAEIQTCGDSELKSIYNRLWVNRRAEPTDTKWLKALKSFVDVKPEYILPLFQDLQRSPIKIKPGEVMLLTRTALAHPEHKQIVLEWLNRLDTSERGMQHTVTNAKEMLTKTSP